MNQFSEKTALSSRLRAYLSLPNLCGLCLLALVIVYYSAKIYPPEAWLGPGIPHGFSLSKIEGTQEKVMGLLVMLIFCAFEFGLYAAILSTGWRRWNRKTKALFLAALAWLFILPFYRYGALNDLVMRASIPSLFFVAILAAQQLSTRPASPLPNALLIILLLLGSATALIEIQRHVTSILHSGSLVSIPSLEQVSSIWDYAMRGPEALLRQYFGSPQAFFFRYLAR